MGPWRTLTVVVNWPLHGASQGELRSQPIRCANAEWHSAACHLALPKLSISPMRPQLQEPQTARCVTLVTQARRVGCYRLSLSTPVQVSKAMNRERYRPDAIGGSLRFQKVDDGWSDTKSSYQELGNARLFPRSLHCISRFHHFCSSLVPANNEHPIDAGGRHRTDD